MKQIKNYRSACEKVADEFVKKYYERPRDNDDFWVADEIGEVLVVGDEYWQMRDIVQALDEDIDRDDLFEWYWHCVDTEKWVKFKYFLNQKE